MEKGKQYINRLKWNKEKNKLGETFEITSINPEYVWEAEKSINPQNGNILIGRIDLKWLDTNKTQKMSFYSFQQMLSLGALVAL